jgi:hypothetical protein
MSYTADDIKILEREEVSAKFFFVRVNELSKQYPSVATDFIARLLESCQLSGFDEGLAIRRYLMKDKSVVPSQELIECHKELLKEMRYFEKQRTIEV